MATKMKRMTRSRMVSRSLMCALAVLGIVAFAVGSAFAFPTPGDSVQVGRIGVLPGAETEWISVNNGGSFKNVYMGPYEIKGPIGSPFLEYMMCFNAGAAAMSGTFVATDTIGASAYFSDTNAAAKISMIAWLASQWKSPLGGQEAIKFNADINRAIWEIMADYDPTSKTNYGLDLGAGSFQLKTDPSIDSDINDVLGYGFLADALRHTQDNTAANFLIPLINGKYDPKSQPFVQPVPEPGTLLLLGSGLVGLGLHGWRKRSKAQK